MKTYKGEGIVLQLRQLKEADKLALLWLPNKGKQAFIVKGANKTLSRKNNALDSLNLISFTAVPSRSEQHLLLEANILDDFDSIKNNLGTIYTVMYMLEVLDRFLVAEEPHRTFYYWFKEMITQFSAQPEANNLFIIYFQLQTLIQTGFSPLLDSCISCYQPLVENSSRMANDNNEPGYICEKHFDNLLKQTKLISDTIIKIQKYLNTTDVEQALKIKVNEANAREIFMIQNTWIESINERIINSKSLLALWKTQIK